MNLVIGKLYQFIDRSYHDFFYLVTDSDHGYNRLYQIDKDNILLLSDKGIVWQGIIWMVQD